jgi:3-phosphoglycerate kinase
MPSQYPIETMQAWLAFPQISFPISDRSLRELEHLRSASSGEASTFVIGGAKIKTKLKLIESYLDKGVHVFVGGAMVHDIWKARGVQIGDSLCDGTTPLSETFLNHPLLMTPMDVVLETGETVAFSAIPHDGKVVDCGQWKPSMLGKIIRRKDRYRQRSAWTL